MSKSQTPGGAAAPLSRTPAYAFFEKIRAIPMNLSQRLYVSSLSFKKNK